jgi:20S proteasome subunit alpha 7
MASSGSGYDLSTSTFSPDGRIFQVEYATKAVENAGTVIGIKAVDGVVLGVAKPIVHKMVVPDTASYKRIHSVDTHVGIAATGFIPDARVAVTRAIDEASFYEQQYAIKIPPKLLADRIGDYMHYFTLHSSLRAFGAACVLAGYDADINEHSLYMIEPNGAAYSYYGVAIGKGKQAAKTELEKLNLHKQGDDNDAGVESNNNNNNNNITSVMAVQHICKMLMLLHQENKDTSTKPLEMEISWICNDSKWKHVGVPRDIIAMAKTWAQQQLADEGDDEDEEEMEQ